MLKFKNSFIQTVVAVFIRDNKLLMEKRSKDKKVYPELLMCPSGHIENGESFEESVDREMKEELGLSNVKSRYLFDIKDKDLFSKKYFNHKIMLIESFSGNIENSREADRLIWKNYDELKKETLALVVRKLVEKLHEQNIF